jgi:hypothetical protein
MPITITMPALPIATKVIQAQLSITGSNLAASPSMLTFTYQQGLPLPAAQSVSITLASGSGSVALAPLRTDVSWLYVSQASVAPATLKVSVSPGLLSAGTYTGDVIVQGLGSPTVSLEIPVTITVTAAAQLTATPATLAFNYQIGGAAPAPQSIALATGNVSVNFRATSPGNWLQLNPASGTTPDSVLVTANPAGLPAGTYSGTINVNHLRLDQSWGHRGNPDHHWSAAAYFQYQSTYLRGSCGRARAGHADADGFEHQRTT